MKQQFNEIKLTSSKGRGFYDLTSEVKAFIKKSDIDNGLVTLYIKHTSASLLINENYDSDVLIDMETFFSNLIPDGLEDLIHITEGPDDMPAHIRSALTQTHLSIPVFQGQLQIGQWQGIFMYEHRLNSHHRTIAIHAIGD